MPLSTSIFEGIEIFSESIMKQIFMTRPMALAGVIESRTQ